MNRDLQLTVSCFNHLTQASSEMHDSIRDVLVAIAPALQCENIGTNEKLLMAILSEHAESNITIVQNVTCTFLTTCFPEHHVPARYLLLLIAGER